MAGTLQTQLYEIRRIIKDRRPNAAVFPTSLIEELSRNELQSTVDDLGMGKLETSALVTIAANVDLYKVTLPTVSYTNAAGNNSTVQIPSFKMLNELVANSLKWPLLKISREEITDRKSGPTQRRGHPLTHFCLYEDTAQQTWLWVDPVPVQSDSLNAVWEPTHPDVTQDQCLLMLTQAGLLIHRLRTAAAVLDSATPAMLEKLGIGPGYAMLLRQQADRAVDPEYFRLNAGHRLGHIVRGR